MPPTFTPLQAAELDRAVAMMARLYAQDGGGFNMERARESTKRLLTEPEFGGVWMIVMDGAAAGYLVVVMGYSLEFGGRFGLLDELFLEEDWRGKGLGRQAIEFAAQQCRKRGWQALRLEVSHSNEPALALYRGCGFDLHDRFLMTKWI